MSDEPIDDETMECVRRHVDDGQDVSAIDAGRLLAEIERLTEVAAANAALARAVARAMQERNRYG